MSTILPTVKCGHGIHFSVLIPFVWKDGKKCHNSNSADWIRNIGRAKFWEAELAERPAAFGSSLNVASWPFASLRQLSAIRAGPDMSGRRELRE